MARSLQVARLLLGVPFGSAYLIDVNLTAARFNGDRRPLWRKAENGMILTPTLAFFFSILRATFPSPFDLVAAMVLASVPPSALPLRTPVLPVLYSG